MAGLAAHVFRITVLCGGRSNLVSGPPDPGDGMSEAWRASLCLSSWDPPHPLLFWWTQYTHPGQQHHLVIAAFILNLSSLSPD